MSFLRLFGVGVAVCLTLDLLWLGVLARAFYQRHLGYLMRPDVQWGPAVLFYLIFVAALVALAVLPALERGSLRHAVGMGALFGLAAYAAFDLTGLALIRGFPLRAALVDLGWGTGLAAAVSAATFTMARLAGWAR